MENINEENKKEFWVTNSRLKFIAAVLFLIFLVFMLLIFLKGEEISKDPCSICAKRMGDKVVCSIGEGGILLQKTYYPNNTIKEGK